MTIHKMLCLQITLLHIIVVTFCAYWTSEANLVHRRTFESMMLHFHHTIKIDSAYGFPLGTKNFLHACIITHHITFLEDKTNILTITWPSVRRTTVIKLITRHLF